MKNKDFIDARELMASFSVEEHIAFSNEYFRGREDHDYLYQKPFFCREESPRTVITLGHLLNGLNLKEGMNVLDFAAGTCWFGRILSQMKCNAYSCDVSEIALNIGRKLIADYPPIHAATGRHHIDFCNGRTLPYPDNFFDCVAVYDAFHHVPNQSEVLVEFARVLKPDGVLGMCEPGRNHSRSEGSQSEMREFSVIESDFVLEEVWDKAQRAGFRNISIMPVVIHSRLDMVEYSQLVAGSGLPGSFVGGCARETIDNSIFFLAKETEFARTGALIYNISEAEFDEDFYLSVNPDVAGAVQSGVLPSGWDHYSRYGKKEGRTARKLSPI